MVAHMAGYISYVGGLGTTKSEKEKSRSAQRRAREGESNRRRAEIAGGCHNAEKFTRRRRRPPRPQTPQP